MLLLFDSGKKLEKAVGEEAAQVIFETFEKFGEEHGRELATKGDVFAVRADLREEIINVRNELREEIMNVRNELREEIMNVRNELREEMHAMRADLRGEIHASKHETLNWVMGLLIAQTGILVALYAIIK